MNAVEIEQAVSELAEQPFDMTGLSLAFLVAFCNLKWPNVGAVRQPGVELQFDAIENH